MAIQDDFTIYPKTKVIRHTSGTTVYSAVAFYSWLMNTFDEPGYLTYETPIKFNTPTSFTIINGWFLDNGDGSEILQYLTAGGIDTSGYATVSDPVYMLDLDNGGVHYAAFAAGDLDNTVTDDAVDVGPLLAYKDTYPSANTARVWVRDTRGTPATIANDSVIDVTGGSGGGDANGTSVNGDEIYHNLYTIAAFAGTPDPQVYIYQNHPQSGTRTRITEWSAFTNWDRGSIDILVPVKLGGTLIDSGNISSFVRQTADTYTFVESTLNTSGRTPIATETSADEVNIAEGEYYLLYDGSNTNSFTAGDIISDVDLSAGVPPTWYAEVVSVTEFSGLATGVIELRGLRGTITDNDNIYVSNVVEGVANGTPGDTYLLYTGGTDPTTLGQVMTGSSTGAKRLLRGVDATADRLVLQDDPTGVTGTNRDAYYKDFTTSDTVTGATNGSVTPTETTNTLISGFNDISVLHINGTVPTGAHSTDFILGERVTWTGGGVAWLVDFVANTSVTLANVDSTDEPASTETITGDLSSATATPSAGLTDANTETYNFSLQSSYNYSVFIEGGSIYNTGRSLTDVYAYLQYYLRDGQSVSERIIYTSDGSSITEVAAEEYIKAASGYSATKPAPFGTLAGGVFFGAQGVWVQGMASADNNNIKFLDTGGTLRYPYTSIDLVISNTRIDDRIAVYLESGSTELPEKTTYTSHNTNNALGDSTFERDTGAMPLDTPTAGTFIVVDDSLNKEHRYRFTERNGTTDPAIFTLPTQIGPYVSDGTTSGQVLDDVSENFNATVQIGDIVHRTSSSLGFCYVTSVATSVLGTTLLEDTSGTAATGWTIGDSYEIHSLVVTYTNSDKFFVPYMDFVEAAGTDASPGSETVSVTYTADREVVIEARNVKNSSYEIVPFKTTNQITSTGMSQSVIRTEDTVYTP